MRVAQVIDSLRMSGGAERLQLLFAKAVAGSDVALTVITLRGSDPGMVSALEALGARVVSFPAGSFLSPARALRFTRFLRRESFDVIHTHLVRATVLGILAGRVAAIPTVATLHNTRRNSRLPDSLRVAEDLVLRHAADRVTAVGWETARVHRERLRGRRIDVIPNAVDAGCTLSDVERTRIRRELGVGPDELLVMAVGRLHPQKAFSDLLQRDRDPASAGLTRSSCGSQASDRSSKRFATEIESQRPRRLRAARRAQRRAASARGERRLRELCGLGGTADRDARGDGGRASDRRDRRRRRDAHRRFRDRGFWCRPGGPTSSRRALAVVLSDGGRRRAQGDAARRRARLHHAVEPWSDRLLELYEEMLGRRPIGEPTESEEGSACA